MSVRTQAGSSVRDHAWEASSGKNNRNGHQCASHFSIKASLKTRTLILKRSTKAAPVLFEELLSPHACLVFLGFRKQYKLLATRDGDCLASRAQHYLTNHGT